MSLVPILFLKNKNIFILNKKHQLFVVCCFIYIFSPFRYIDQAEATYLGRPDACVCYCFENLPVRPFFLVEISFFDGLLDIFFSDLYVFFPSTAGGIHLFLESFPIFSFLLVNDILIWVKTFFLRTHLIYLFSRLFFECYRLSTWSIFQFH